MEGLKENNIFVTGATGLIGSHLTIKLVGLGANVVILKRDHVKDSYLETTESINKINIAHGELEDFDSILRIVSEYEIDTIFHLGAQAIETTSVVEPRKTFESNIKGTWNILEASRLVGYESDLLKKIIIATSDKSYGPAQKPYTEDMPLKGKTPYDVSKSCADLISQSYYETYGLPVCIARLGNVYGPGDLNFNRIIPGTIKSILEDTNIVIRSDGTNIREYIHVSDAVSAYVTLAEQIEKAKGKAFNFSSGEQLSVLDAVEKIKKAMSSRQEVKILNIAKNEIPRQILSTERAKSELGWSPKVKLETGLPLTIDWYRQFLSK